MKLLRKSTSANPTRSPTPTATAHVNNCEDQSASPARDTNLGLFHQFNSIRSRRKSRADLLASIDSTASPSYRYQEEQVRKQHSLLDLRRRIVRKASTFNLHTRHRSTLQSNTDDLRSEHLFLDSDQDPAQPARASSLLAHDERPSTASTNYSEAVETIQQRESTDDSSSVYSQITTVPARRHTLAFTSPSDEKPLSIPKRASVDYLVAQRNQKVLEAQSEIVRQHSNYREKHIDGSGVWVKMATPSAAPPLAFEKLKQITVEACESALGTTESYEHSKTQEWNTTIINTILSQLVGATEDSDDQQKSKWKFVVNSTIIQHRSSSSVDENGKQSVGGRRGMHSAAGAYWNNERDGMWSFKYEAADKMGLDVIVGIVWIWVG